MTAIATLSGKEVESQVGMRLDLGCGQHPREGFLGVDLYAPNAIYQYDLLTFPWKFADEIASEVHCSHFFEHVPNKLRFAFMDELWRVMQVGAQASIIVPYYSSMRAIQDPTHEWPPVSETSFLYFNKGWREQTKLDHYPVKCDFDFTYGYALDPETGQRATEVQSFWAKHYVNAIADLHVTLTKRAK